MKSTATALPLLTLALMGCFAAHPPRVVSGRSGTVSVADELDPAQRRGESVAAATESPTRPALFDIRLPPESSTTNKDPLAIVIEPLTDEVVGEYDVFLYYDQTDEFSADLDSNRLAYKGLVGRHDLELTPEDLFMDRHPEAVCGQLLLNVAVHFNGGQSHVQQFGLYYFFDSKESAWRVFDEGVGRTRYRSCALNEEGQAARQDWERRARGKGLSPKMTSPSDLRQHRRAE